MVNRNTAVPRRSTRAAPSVEFGINANDSVFGIPIGECRQQRYEGNDNRMKYTAVREPEADSIRPRIEQLTHSNFYRHDSVKVMAKGTANEKNEIIYLVHLDNFGTFGSGITSKISN